MKFWYFVNATARLLKRLTGDAFWNVKARFVKLCEDFAHIITPLERDVALGFILNI